MTYKSGDHIVIPVNSDGKTHYYRLVTVKEPEFWFFDRSVLRGDVVLQHLETQGPSSLSIRAKDINNITEEEMSKTHGLIGKKFERFEPIVTYDMRSL